MTSSFLLDDHPLHPLDRELTKIEPNGRAQMHAGWKKRFSEAPLLLQDSFIADAPLVASSALMQELDAHTHALCRELAPLLTKPADDEWASTPAADALALDFAIVQSEPGAARPWTLRCVEFQAFASIAATNRLVAEHAAEVWPQLRDLAEHDGPTSDWLARMKLWVAPGTHNVLVERDPWGQKTAFDFQALERLTSIKVVDDRQLRLRNQVLQLNHEQSGAVAVDHILNRLVLHTAPDADQQLLASARVSWHSHPRWYYRISKALMPGLNLPQANRCVLADDWRSLGVPAERLVLKATHSFGGADVHLHVTGAQLDALEHPRDWLVQPRFTPLPIRQASDGAPIFGELRCMVALMPGQRPWVASRIARLYRGDKASSSTFSSLGCGLAAVLSAPGHTWGASSC